MNKPVIAADALLGVLGTGVAVQTLTRDDEPITTETAAPKVNTVPLGEKASTGPAKADQNSQGGEDGNGDKGDQGAGVETNERDVKTPATKQDAARIARLAIKAYTEHSYRDPKATSWIDRIKPYATDGFHHNLVETFSAKDPYWEKEVVPNQRETRTTVTDVTVSGMHKQTRQKVVYDVTYKTAVKTKDMKTWGDPDPQTMWVYLWNSNGTWQVVDIAPTGTRSSGAF